MESPVPHSVQLAAAREWTFKSVSVGSPPSVLCRWLRLTRCLPGLGPPGKLETNVLPCFSLLVLLWWAGPHFCLWHVQCCLASRGLVGHSEQRLLFRFLFSPQECQAGVWDIQSHCPLPSPWLTGASCLPLTLGSEVNRLAQTTEKCITSQCTQPHLPNRGSGGGEVGHSH